MTPVGRALRNKRSTNLRLKNDMDTEIKIVRGPSSTRLAKEAAASELEKQPGFPEGASYTIEEIDGRWIAAVVMPKEAAPFPPGGGDEAPSGPPSGPPSDDSESGPPSDEGDEKPEGEKKDEGGDEPSSEGPPKQEHGGVEHMLANLTDMLTKITDALGLSTPADGMIPGADDGAVPPPGGPPHGGPSAPGDSDPSTPGKQGPDGKIHTVHERSLKPGEAPPGTTPVGAPAFASVQVEDGHPWKDAIESNVKEFEVESDIGDAAISTVAAELRQLAEPYGYQVTDIAPNGVGTSRTASARIVRTR